MDKNTLIRTALAGSVTAAGLAVGGIAIASADDDTAPGAPAAGAFDHPRGPGEHFRLHDDGELAQALGVSEAKLRSALDKVRADLRPAQRPDGPPSAADLKAMQAKFGQSLAKALGISPDKVTQALEKVRAAHEAAQRAALVSRLDAAVKAGTLTADDRASVLKAFDAGVLDGPPGPR